MGVVLPCGGRHDTNSDQYSAIYCGRGHDVAHDSLEALANAPVAFGEALEDAERQTIDDYRKTVSGPFPPFATFDGVTAIGTAGFYILGGPKMSHQGVLWGMYVSPTHRGQGVGRKLIGSIIDHARGRVEQIHLHVVTTNSALLPLSEHGFRTLRRRTTRATARGTRLRRSHDGFHHGITRCGVPL